jgi:hypothetical protein
MTARGLFAEPEKVNDMRNKDLVLWIVACAIVGWLANRARPVVYDALKDLTS